MDLILIALAAFLVIFFLGYYTCHKLTLYFDMKNFAQARQELSKYPRSELIDFYPGTTQYRPVVSGRKAFSIDKLFTFETDVDFGIGGAYTQDEKFTIEEYPIIIAFAPDHGDSFIELGKNIESFGLKLKRKYEAD